MDAILKSLLKEIELNLILFLYMDDYVGILPPFTKVSSNCVKISEFVESFSLIILAIKSFILG
jgi:hypothetical protein